MNRTILIVICDFLLVSLLAFSTVDINKAADEGSERRVTVDIATNQVVEGGRDVTAVMRLALEEEKKQRDQLLGELSRSRDTSVKQESLLGEREKQLKSVQQESLQLQQQQTNLLMQFATAQTNIQSLSKQLQVS